MRRRGLFWGVVLLLVQLLKGLIELVRASDLNSLQRMMLGAEIRTLRALRAAATASPASKSSSPGLAGNAETTRARKKQRARKDKLKRAILDEKWWYSDYCGCDF